MFTAFDIIRIVNLPERRDRREETERQLAAVGLAGDPRVAFFPAVRPPDAGAFSSIGARGCYESHLAILREAAAADKSVLIIEDDCDFAAHAKEYDAGTGWQIFYGGYTALDPSDLAHSDIIGSHMMGFTAQGAARICAYLDDLRWDGVHPPIDAAYIWFRRAHPEAPTHFAAPPLANQRASRSDIADLRIYDRLPLVRDAVNLMRKVLRQTSG